MDACLCENAYVCSFGHTGPEKGRDQGRRQKKPERSKPRTTHNKSMKISVYFLYVLKCLF